MAVRTTVLPTSEVLPVLDEILALKQQFWPHPLASQRRWFDEHVTPQDLHVLARLSGDAVIGYTRIAFDASRACKIIDTVCVRKDAHKRGVGSALMQAANAAILGGGWSGLLSCDAALVPFYASCGWQTVTSPGLRAGEVTMRLFNPAAVTR